RPRSACSSMSRTTFWPDASCLRPGNGHSHRVEGRAWLVCSTKQRELRNDATRFVPASKLLRHIQTTHQLFQLYQLDSSAVANCRPTPAHHLQGVASVDTRKPRPCLVHALVRRRQLSNGHGM